jgi:plasmid maintenance system antidote protein VapI
VGKKNESLLSLFTLSFAGIKRERPTSAVATAEMGDAPVKKQKKVATILPITEEEIVGLLRNDPNMTLAKLIGLFKNSFGTDPDKKSKFQKIVAKVAVTKTIDGNKVLRLK